MLSSVKEVIQLHCTCWLLSPWTIIILCEITDNTCYIHPRSTDSHTYTDSYIACTHTSVRPTHTQHMHAHTDITHTRTLHTRARTHTTHACTHTHTHIAPNFRDFLNSAIFCDKTFVKLCRRLFNLALCD